MARQALSLVDVPESTRDLTDFSSTEPTDGQVPVWDSGEGKYVPGANGGGAGTAPQFLAIAPRDWWRNAPVGDETTGQLVFVSGAPTGAFAGWGKTVARKTDSGWEKYYDPATATAPAVVFCPQATRDSGSAGGLTLRSDLGVGWVAASGMHSARAVGSSEPGSPQIGAPYFIDGFPGGNWTGQNFKMAISNVASPAAASDWAFFPVDFGATFAATSGGSVVILYDVTSTKTL